MLSTFSLAFPIFIKSFIFVLWLLVVFVVVVVVLFFLFCFLFLFFVFFFFHISVTEGKAVFLQDSLVYNVLRAILINRLYYYLMVCFLFCFVLFYFPFSFGFFITTFVDYLKPKPYYLLYHSIIFYLTFFYLLNILVIHKTFLPGRRSLEYADCIPYLGVTKKGCPRHDTKLYLMVKF